MRGNSGPALPASYSPGLNPTPITPQDWVLYLSSAQREGADVVALAAVEAAAAATGLPLTGVWQLSRCGSPAGVPRPGLPGVLRPQSEATPRVTPSMTTRHCPPMPLHRRAA